MNKRPLESVWHLTRSSLPRHIEKVSDAPSSADPLIGSLIAERYRIDELLGAGAMGAVYRAEHILMRKPVALKVLHSASSENEEVVARFEREAIAAGRIGHPHVAAATDFGRLDDGSFYLVLEYIKGKSLGRLIKESSPFQLEQSCLIGIQIASALNAAHTQGIVHRDLKPENVMIPDAAQVGDHDATLLATPLSLSVKVLDFGLAKMSHGNEAEATQLTQAGAVYGTPQYMSPEQTEGKAVDHRADLYALGLILFEMLEGNPPFTSAEVMPLLVMQMTKEAPKISSHYPEDLRLLISQLLEKDPAQRPQSASDIIPRLTPYLGESSISSGYSDVIHSSPSLAPQYRIRQPQAARRLSAKTQLALLLKRTWNLLKLSSRRQGQLQGFLMSPVSLGRVAFPRALPIGFFITSIIVAVWLFNASGSATQGKPLAPKSTARIQTIDPELLKVINAAQQGSDSALYALEQRDDGNRTPKEWLALAQARLMRQKVSSALEAYQPYLDSGPRLTDEAMVLGALRRLADNINFAPAILEFIAQQEQSDAPDFLFDVWSRTAQKTPATTLAWESLKESLMVDNYSEPLRLALALREASECSELTEILPLLIESGDQRSSNRLKALRKTTGCGKNEGEDCYPCLRDTPPLEGGS